MNNSEASTNKASNTINEIFEDSRDQFTDMLSDIITRVFDSVFLGVMLGSYLTTNKIDAERIHFDSLNDTKSYLKRQTKIYAEQLLANIVVPHDPEAPESEQDAVDRMDGEADYQLLIDKLNLLQLGEVYRKHNQRLTAIAHELKGKDYSGSDFEQCLRNNRAELATFFTDLIKCIQGDAETIEPGDENEELGFTDCDKYMYSIFFKQLLPQLEADNILESIGPLLFTSASKTPNSKPVQPVINSDATPKSEHMCLTM